MQKYKERVEIGCYTKMSEMMGISSVKEYIDEAVKREWNVIGITDLDSTQSLIEAQEYIKEKEIKNLKLIYGVKTRVMNDEEKNEIKDMIILVKKQKGLRNLYTLLSEAFLNKFENKPVLLKSQLNQYRDGLLYGICGIDTEENLNEKIKYYDFIQIEPIYHSKNENEKVKLQEINKKLIELGDKNNILVIASSNPLFVKKEDSICNEILNYSKGIMDYKCNNGRYLHTTKEMLQEFSYLGKKTATRIVVDNTNKLAETCEEVKPIHTQKSEKSYPKIANARNILKEETYEKAHEIYGKELPQNVFDRLELELNSICKNGFETIYLMARDSVRKSNELGYSVELRGSVGNSFVAFLLGITEYNPIEYRLPFELFAGKNLDREPDIDLNFSGQISDQVREYIAEKYGGNHLIYCGTIATIWDRTARQMIEKYCKDLNYPMEEKKKKEVMNKLVGIKRGTGVHPGGIFVLSEDKDIKEVTPIENDKWNDKDIVKTHVDYHFIWKKGFYKFDILSHDTPTILHRLEEMTKINPKDIDLNDKETLAIFLNAGNEKYEISTRGIPEFWTKFSIEMLKKAKPKNFNDLVCLCALGHGSGVWNWNAESLIENKYIAIDKVVSNPADSMNFLIDNGIDKKTAWEITNFIKEGKTSRKSSKEFCEKWNEYREIMIKNNIPEWYIESCEKIEYLFPKAHAIAYVMDSFRIAWYKVHCPEAFYKVYFEIKGKIHTEEYTNKKQIERKIMQLEDLDEAEEIDDLKILLEMYQRGIRQEVRIKDDYDLINSRAISDYCRQIKHQFNTEELAVLVYRNKRMSIDEKMDKYKDLIQNYPDMEVIERINCNHYDSVKDMIKSEIERLTTLKDKLFKKEEGVVYGYEQYYTSIRKWDKNWDYFNELRTTFEEIDKKVLEEIEKYNDILAYQISKKYFYENEPIITAEYQVIDGKRILNHICEEGKQFGEMDAIFLNLPNPFKKGDILVSWDNIPYREGLPVNHKDIFVLNYLCTWREGLEEYLAKGNHDASDMMGYGYYMLEDSDEFICDDKWNYDCFEYYEGELEGMDRTLKAISSFLKNKIELECFVHAYEKFKYDNRCPFMDCYTEDGLKLAGFSESDFLKRKNSAEDKMYNLTEDEKMDYLKHATTLFFKGICKEDIKQIEMDSEKCIYDTYVLLKNGDLYKNEEKISSNIDRIYILNRKHFYQITKDNKIIPLQEIYSWNDWDKTDKYLNNNNCSYQKIVTSRSHIVALTKNREVRALHTKHGLGIVPENFKEVEDIIIVTEADNTEVPYIFKNKQYKPLYIG